MDTETTPANAAPPELAPEFLPPPPEPPPEPSPEELLEAQYQGPKAALRPIYESLAYLAGESGRGVRAKPTLTTVVFERKGIPFAVVKVSSRTRVDLGLALPDMKPQAPWKTARRYGGVERVTHRVELFSLGDVDGLLVQWMAEAYELAKPPKVLKPRESSVQEEAGEDAALERKAPAPSSARSRKGTPKSTAKFPSKSAAVTAAVKTAGAALQTRAGGRKVKGRPPASRVAPRA